MGMNLVFPDRVEVTMPRKSFLLAMVLLAAATMPIGSRAKVDEATRAARWEELRGAIFGDRAVENGDGLISLEAPSRAEDAAIVPIRIALAEELRPQLRELYLVIDDNPSPLAGRFAFGPAAEPSAISTRVRVDDST